MYKTDFEQRQNQRIMSGVSYASLLIPSGLDQFYQKGGICPKITCTFMGQRRGVKAKENSLILLKKTTHKQIY